MENYIKQTKPSVRDHNECKRCPIGRKMSFMCFFGCGSVAEMLNTFVDVKPKSKAKHTYIIILCVEEMLRKKRPPFLQQLSNNLKGKVLKEMLKPQTGTFTLSSYFS